jgi:hypothetical protein
MYYIFDQLIEIDRVTACTGKCLIALRATAKRPSISAAKSEVGTRRGGALVSATLRPLYAV